MLAFCSGCVVTCLNSPFDISRAEADKGLIGVWRISDAEGGGSINFRSMDNKQFQMTITKEGQPPTEMFTGYSGKIDGRNICGSHCPMQMNRRQTMNISW
jgi:hypothetical protein